MRLVASSNPEDVKRDQAIQLLSARAVLTRAVCRELTDSGGAFNDRRPRFALALLVQWIAKIFPDAHTGSPAWWGLDDMIVPEDCEDLRREIRDGADVCEALAMLFCADSRSDAEGDTKVIVERLDAYLNAHAQIVVPPNIWPL